MGLKIEKILKGGRLHEQTPILISPQTKKTTSNL